jgi:predicted nucleotidyltransferase/uncharacterized protein (UPF0332 family)
MAIKEEKSEEKHKKQEDSFEKNLAMDYVPKSKLGNLPVQSQLPPEIQKEMEKTQKEIEKLKTQLVEKFKFVEEIGILPAQAAGKIEEEYEIPEEDAKRKLIHILAVIPEDNFKDIGKVRLEAIKIAKEINDKFWVHIMTPVDIWNLCLDSKFEIIEAMGMAFPILDKGLLAALRVAQIHKTLVLKKFEKYVSSYVMFGSLVRGTAKKDSDVDVAIIIDDTDVKRMPRLELKEKLRSIIYQYIAEATAIAGVKNILNVQVYLMTEFWEAVKDAHPVMFTLIRDGVPLYDRGTFLPWKLLLKMGKIKPSQEAIDMFMSAGDKLQESIERRMMDIMVYDIYWGVLTPSQALLMLYGIAPSTPRDTVTQIRDIFVEKEKILEKKYGEILAEIVEFYKDYEGNPKKKISGLELDKFFKDTMDYMRRLKELRQQIEKRVQEKTIEQVYKDVFGMLEAMLKKKTEKEVIQTFEEQLVKTGRFPQRFTEGLKFVSKVYAEFMEEEKEAKAKKKKEKTTGKGNREVEEARKIANEIINALIEYNQRCDFLSMDRSKFLLKVKGEVRAEVFFLNDAFIIQGSQISRLSGFKLCVSNSEELRKQLAEHQSKETKIQQETLENLKKIFGDFELSY